MKSKKSSLLSGFIVNRLLCLVIVFSSLYQLRASEDLVENSGQKESCRAFTEDYPAFRVGSGDGSSSGAQGSSYFKDQINHWSNKLFQYDARIASATNELARWQACLAGTGDCAGFDVSEVPKKIAVLNEKIHKLNADKNRPVTWKDAFPYLVSALVLGGGAAYLASRGQSDEDRLEELDKKYRMWGGSQEEAKKEFDDIVERNFEAFVRHKSKQGSPPFLRFSQTMKSMSPAEKAAFSKLPRIEKLKAVRRK